MPLSGGREETVTFQFGPLVGTRVIGPHVVEPIDTVRASEQVELVIVGNHRVIRPSGRDLAGWWPAFMGASDQELPSVVRVLQRIQVKGDQIVEKVAFDLASKNVEFRPKNVQRVAVASRGPRAGRDGS